MSQDEHISQGVGGMNLNQQDAPVAPNPAPEAVLDDGTNYPHPPSDGEVSDGDERRRGPGDQNNAPMETDNGEFVHARRVARSDGVVINGQSSRDVIIAAAAVLVEANNAQRAARANRPQNRRSGSVSHQAGSGESPRFGESPRPVAHWNKNWLNVVLSFAKDRKYDGLSLVPQTHDQKHRFQAYKYNVGAAIKLCQGPAGSLVEDQCAILLCDGSALQLVIDFTELNRRDPSKAELFIMLEHQLLGSISGDLTICQKLDTMHCDDLARVLQARMTKGVVGVDLASILNLASSELKLRPVQMDTASHVLWILSVFRDLSGGKSINPQLLEIRTNAGRCMKDGVWAEQMDPIAMLKQVAGCSIAWDLYYDQHLSKSGGGGGVGNSGALVGGATLRGEKSSKRPFSPSSEGQKGTTMQGMTRQAFDPFVSYPNQCVADKSDTCRKWFVRGQARVDMDGLMKAGKCVLCKATGHMLAACPTRGSMFASKKFCFHPTK